MKVNILIFGQLADITGKAALTLTNVTDTETLKKLLQQQYPAMAELPYLIAVDKEVVLTNTVLNNNCTVALLPPYAGG